MVSTVGTLQVVVMHSLFVCLFVGLFVLWDGMEFVLSKPQSSKLCSFYKGYD